MQFNLAMSLEHEDLMRAESKRRFPSLDQDYVADRWLGQGRENAKKTAKIVALMMPEILRAMKEKEC
jgi:hypothetical protein